MAIMTKRSHTSFASLALVSILLSACSQDAVETGGSYPTRPITLIVPWNAGGGTDATGRMIATLLKEELGQPVNVVNRSGGSGVVGHSAIANAEPDGYTIGVITAEIGMMHWIGLTELTAADYTPIALYNYDAAGLQVRADSEWTSANDVLEAIRANPGRHKGSGTGQGGIWHLALAGLLESAGISPDAAPWVPSQGATPGLLELVSGGVDIVTCSLAEADSLIRAGKVRPLAIMADARLDAFPDVPTLKEATGLDWQLEVWRGIGGPSGMPEEATDVLAAALEKVVHSVDFQEFMAARGFGVSWKSGPEFAVWMVQSDAAFGDVMKSLGIAE